MLTESYYLAFTVELKEDNNANMLLKKQLLQMQLELYTFILSPYICPLLLFSHSSLFKAIPWLFSHCKPKILQCNLPRNFPDLLVQAVLGKVSTHIDKPSAFWLRDDHFGCSRPRNLRVFRVDSSDVCMQLIQINSGRFQMFMHTHSLGCFSSRLLCS